MVMEYWTGWFRHWNEPQPQKSLSAKQAADGLKTILSLKSSVNLYMFHGMEFVVWSNLGPISCGIGLGILRYCVL